MLSKPHAITIYHDPFVSDSAQYILCNTSNHLEMSALDTHKNRPITAQHFDSVCIPNYFKLVG